MERDFIDMNICIIGFGSIGPVHAEAVHNIPGATLYGICDIDKQRADSGAKKYGAKAYYSLDEVIADNNIDSVHICTPHYLHYKMITAAADAGKKVVCEKPITMTEEEFDRLAANYSDYGIFPIIQNRTNKCIRELKRLAAEDNTLGKLMGIKGEMTWCRGADYYNSAEWRGTKKYEGGGVLINQAVHTLDLMVYFGGRPRSVIASMSNNSLKGIIEVEDTVDARLKFESGTVGIFYATNAYSASPQPTLTLNYENAEFLYADGKLYKDGVKICEDESGFLGKRNWGSGHMRTLYDFYVNNSALGISDISDTMYAMFGIYKSAEENSRKVTINCR